MNESPAHCTAQCGQVFLGGWGPVPYSRVLCSALKLFWHLLLLKEQGFDTLARGFNQEHSASQPSPLQANIPPPYSLIFLSSYKYPKIICIQILVDFYIQVVQLPPYYICLVLWLNSDIVFCPTETAFPQVLIVPVPVPVYVPLPMNMYTQCTPRPLGVPLPVSYWCQPLNFCLS